MHRAWSAVLLVLSVAVLPGCDQRVPLNAMVATATSPTGGRVAAAGQLAAEWRAGRAKIDPAIDLAFEMIDSAANTTPLAGTGGVAKSADATAFAGAVLDAIAMLGTQLPQAPEMEIFWMRVGGLAFAAAEEAHAAGRLAESRNLVFAGGSRWQSDAYWYQHAAHDGLASVILAKTGEGGEAIRRLQDRPDLRGPAAEVYEMLRK